LYTVCSREAELARYADVSDGNFHHVLSTPRPENEASVGPTPRPENEAGLARNSQA
jgi:hypothetical protein